MKLKNSTYWFRIQYYFEFPFSANYYNFQIVQYHRVLRAPFRTTYLLGLLIPKTVSGLVEAFALLSVYFSRPRRNFPEVCNCTFNQVERRCVLFAGKRTIEQTYPSVDGPDSEGEIIKIKRHIIGHRSTLL